MRSLNQVILVPVLLGFIFSLSSEGAVTEERAEELIHHVVSLYADEIESVHHLPIDIKFHWHNDIIQALGGRVDSRRQVELVFYGGLIKGDMDEDTLLAVVCHEIGHILGGSPERRPYSSKMNSVEGQADYFASAKCLRRLYSERDNAPWLSQNEVPSAVSSACHAAFSEGSQSAAVCMRTLVSSLRFFRLMREDPDLSYDNPDPRIVTSTLMEYPSTQCRLDTLLAGAVCPIDPEISLSFSNPRTGACVRGRSTSEDRGARPRCWYKPDAP